MTVETKIAEAERWFKKIEQAYPNERTELQDNVNAFLNAINSIPDHLLEDYNVKFGLAIPLNTMSFRKEFDSKVSKSNNQTLLSFYLWFKIKRKFVEKRDKICAILSHKRHVNIHRFTTGPTINSMRFHFSVPITNPEPQLPMYLKSGRVFKINSKKPKIKKTTITLTPDSSSLDIYFQELEEVNVRDACKHILDSMKNLVSESHQKFPIAS